MDFHFTGKYVLKNGFRAPSLKTYVEDTYKKLGQKLQVPAYATAGEQQRIEAVTEKLAKKPFAGRVVFNEFAKNWADLTPVSYGRYPLLYDICFHAQKVLGSAVPVLYVFDGYADAANAYQAMAVDYMDRFYLYMSNRLLLENDMSSPEELCFILGHELGHAQCHHSTLRLLTKSSGGSNAEYSADRAGLLVAAEWLQDQHPDWPLDKLGREAVLAAATILDKLGVGFQAVQKNKPVDWAAYDAQAVRQRFEAYFADPTKLKRYFGSHPSDEHRAVAMHRFACSEMFCRLMGREPGPGMYSDALLEEVMHYHIQD